MFSCWVEGGFAESPERNGQMKAWDKIKGFFGAQDMTVGNPTKVLIRFALPLLIGNFAQQLYNTVDAVVVGRYAGDNALAAVGASGPILNLIIALLMGVSTGAGILVSQYFGAKNREQLSHTICNVLSITVIVGLLSGVLGLVITNPFLRIMSTPDEIFTDSSSYLSIIMIGFVGCALYNIGAGILRGLGDSVMPLVFLLLACGLNIGLDILFVAVFGMGVPGVAIATVIAQSISALCCVLRILRMKDVFDAKKRYFIPDKDICLRIFKIGMPVGATQAIFSGAQLMVQSLINSFGTSVIATCIAIMRVDGFAMMPNFTFGMSMTTYVGQNIGAGNVERVHSSAKYGLRLALLVSAVLVVLILLFGRQLLMMFTDTESVLDLGARMLKVLAVGYICFAVTQVLGGVMRGAGDTVTPMIISVITTIGVRVPLAYGLAYITRSPELVNGAPESIYYSLLAAWMVGAIITALCFRFGKWREKAKKSELQTVQSKETA